MGKHDLLLESDTSGEVMFCRMLHSSLHLQIRSQMRLKCDDHWYRTYYYVDYHGKKYCYDIEGVNCWNEAIAAGGHWQRF